MNLRRCVWLTAIVLLVVVMVSGCAKKVPPPLPPPPPEPPAAPAPPPPPPPQPTPPVAPPQPQRPLTEEEIFSRKTLDELNAEAPLAEVLFNYDQFTVRDDQRAVLQKNAAWMQRWPSTRVSIEGHTDARGTNEYNLALGERRGNAVREYLVGLGIAANRLVVVSKGEETPLCSEESEACFERNRRAHFVITAK